VILDANLLLYASNSADPRHERAADVVQKALNGPRRVGLPWQTLSAFARIATHPRVFPSPLSADDAALQVEQWLAAPAAWVPVPTPRHAEIFLQLLRAGRVTGAMVTDAHLAALALEHGVAIWSTDADFARFDGVVWHDPLR